MLFVLLFLPLALYLLFLGWVNRQPRAIVVSGPLDCLGLVFAAAGFLLAGGPAVLSSVNDSWRQFWMFGEVGRLEESLDAARGVWLAAAGGYFLAVVAGCGWLLWRSRAVTCIYNVEPATVEAVLTDVSGQLGLEPIRSGNLFVLGLPLAAPRQHPAGVQAPHSLIRDGGGKEPVVAQELSFAESLGGQNAAVEVEAFAPLKHVTLRWDPADSLVRTAVERELTRRLYRIGSPLHETGPWLDTLGSGLLVLTLVTLVAVVVRLYWSR